MLLVDGKEGNEPSELRGFVRERLAHFKVKGLIPRRYATSTKPWLLGNPFGNAC